MSPEVQELINRMNNQLERKDLTNPYYKKGEEEQAIRLKIEEIKRTEKKNN